MGSPGSCVNSVYHHRRCRRCRRKLCFHLGSSSWFDNLIGRTWTQLFVPPQTQAVIEKPEATFKMSYDIFMFHLNKRCIPILRFKSYSEKAIRLERWEAQINITNSDWNYFRLRLICMCGIVICIINWAWQTLHLSCGTWHWYYVLVGGFIEIHNYFKKRNQSWWTASIYDWWAFEISKVKTLILSFIEFGDYTLCHQHSMTYLSLI